MIIKKLLKEIIKILLAYKKNISLYIFIIMYAYVFKKIIPLLILLCWIRIWLKLIRGFTRKELIINKKSYVDNMVWIWLWNIKNPTEKSIVTLVQLMTFSFILGLSLYSLKLWLNLYECLAQEFSSSNVRNDKMLKKYLKNSLNIFKEEKLIPILTDEQYKRLKTKIKITYRE